MLQDAKLLDVDYLVPLAEAWDASRDLELGREGAGGLRQRPRRARALIAVSARSNRSKADKDVTDWLPPATAYRCTYLADWAAIKTRWSLTVDWAEADTLRRLTTGCPNEPLTVICARLILTGRRHPAMRTVSGRVRAVPGAGA